MGCGTNLCSKVLIRSMIVHVLQVHFICLLHEGKGNRRKGKERKGVAGSGLPEMQYAIRLNRRVLYEYISSSLLQGCYHRENQVAP